MKHLLKFIQNIGNLIISYDINQNVNTNQNVNIENIGNNVNVESNNNNINYIPIIHMI